MSEPRPQGTPPTPAPNESKKRLGPREIGGLVALVLLIVFIAENTRKVKIRFIIPQVTAPLWVAFLIAALVGALAFWLIQHRLQSRKSRKTKK